jgi:single-strand DNA-binding protein
MADYNRTIQAGRLTFDPELRHIPSGKAVTELRMVTNKRWTQDGEKKEKAVYFDVTVWGVQAENCCKYLKKGSSLLVEGSLDMDQWEDKNTGEKRSKLKVVADNVVFLDSRPRDDGDRGQRDEPRQAATRGQGSAPQGRSGGAPQGRGGYAGQGRSAPVTQAEADDDLPF